MGLEDSAPLTTEYEGLDSGLGDAPPTADKKMSSPAENLEPETTDTRGKATHTSRGKKKSSSLCEAPAQEENARRLLRKSSRKKPNTDSESDKILEQKKKKSLEKVTEWLLKVPPEADLELERSLEKADESDSSSSTSAPLAEPHDVELKPRKEDHAKVLEEQVFGAVYKRRSRKSLEPSTAAKVPNHKSLSKLRKKKHPTVTKKQQMIENKTDTSSDIFQDAEQVKVRRKRDMSKNLEEFNQPSVSDRGEEHNVSRPVSDVRQQPETITKKRTRKAVQQVDSDLQEQAQANSTSAEQKKADCKTTRSEKKKRNKVAKPLVLVGVQNRETSPKAKERSEDVQVQIETYPSSEDQDTPVLRSTRRSKRLKVFVEEVQGCHKKATMKTCPPKKDRNVAKPSEHTKGETSHLAPPESINATKAAKTNGCVYDQDIEGIETLENAEQTFDLLRAETASEAVAESCISVDPNFTSATDASVVAPTFENDKPANNPPNTVQQEPPVIESKCAPIENEDYTNDSELEMEQLVRSFKAAKRKSFHLGEANLKRSRFSDKENGQAIEAEDCIETSQKQMPGETLEGSKGAEKSSCSDLVPPSHSPIQMRRSTVDQAGQTVVDASVLDSSCSSEDSGLSPNKISKVDRESPCLSVVPQVADSGFRFTTVEPEALTEASKGSQVTGGQLDFGKVTDNDSNEQSLIAVSSLTPNDLIAPALQIAHKMSSGRSGEVSPQSSIKTNSRKKRRAQKLESSCESDSSNSKEKLPTLTELFGISTRPPAGIEGQGGSAEDNGRGSDCGKTDGAEPQSRPLTRLSPDCVDSSQASVDLFGTPEECKLTLTN